MTDDKPARDLTKGIALGELTAGTIVAGRVGDDAAIVTKVGAEVFAIGAHCTHYHGPLAEGLIVGETIRCPWHHACFSLRTGEALRAPALDTISCWRVEQLGDRVFVRDKLPEQLVGTPAAQNSLSWPASVVIVGGGAAGLAAADILRREGYDKPITMLSDDAAPPCDRPNLSKDYLAGKAQEDWIPLRPQEFYVDRKIDLVLGAHASSMDLRARKVQLADGRAYSFGALLLATGAEPVRLMIDGADQPRVLYLRTLADSNAIIARASTAKRVVIIGASFIGLEVAASLRARGIEVHVVAPESRPLERTLGPELGAFIENIHRSQGVIFHLGRTSSRIDQQNVTLDDGTTLDAEMIVVGIGVRPRVALAEQAGLKIDRGIQVNEYLETSAPGVFAAGDIARWPDPHTGDRIRVEHWVVAERQGQTAARNILGAQERFEAVPFFWSQHYDAVINYVGHAESWDRVEIDGRLEDSDSTVTYLKGGRRLAVATVFRDRKNLEVEREMERAQNYIS